MQRISSRLRPALLCATALAISSAAFAAPQAGGAASKLPPPGTMSAGLPAGVDIFSSMFVSDSKHIVGDGMGATAVEAKARARMECQKTAPDCVELATFPIRNHCTGIAADKGAVPGKRAVFVMAAASDTAEAKSLGASVMEQCTASGAKQCEVQLEYCF